MAEAQTALIKLGKLARDAQSALEANDRPLMRQIDVEIDLVIGQKERAIGAYDQHVKEHGC